jgi:hypothetical protein
MASYRGHLAFSSALGVVYGGAALLRWDYDWGPAVLAAGLTTLGGLLPDLDSDSSVPLREMFSLAATVSALLLYQRLQLSTPERTLAVLGGVYLFVRYGVSYVFKHLTVHRGMFHSLPAMCISGLATFLVYHDPDVKSRIFLACGVMLGFLSHLVLDTLYGVDFLGGKLRQGKHTGSPLKLASTSWVATLTTYSILGGLGLLAAVDAGALTQH